MPIGYLSIRIDTARRDHHLWLNNGTWWVHYTLHWDGRKRRIRRSLRTRDLGRAIQLRDELFAHIRGHGEFVAPRRKEADGLGGVSALRVPSSKACSEASSADVAPAPWLVGA